MDVRFQPVIFWFFDFHDTNGTATLCYPSVSTFQASANIDVKTMNTTVKVLSGPITSNPDTGPAYNALFFPDSSFADPEMAQRRMSDAQQSLPEAALHAAYNRSEHSSIPTHFQNHVSDVYVRLCQSPHTACILLISTRCHQFGCPSCVQKLYLQLTAQYLYLVPLNSPMSLPNAQVEVRRTRILLVYVTCFCSRIRSF